MSHPEQSKSEIFVGNTKGTTVPAYLSSLATARVGKQAFELGGEKRIDPNKMRPLFVDRSEAGRYDAIMMARFKAINQRSARITRPVPEPLGQLALLPA
ncbi:hypothetical protein AVME950_02445 [Acidovorax sp. SUPP950]|uniref:hypothetical protein n=1 Tax=Acidovorax sp. SUPP950 TaxID=511901 RepID=UPI0023CB00F5|nr:hypothetical protein [Acidovorax sp. SUPP950]GKS73707.1 hypothetical protein AVME950_02445 [Acidovorax sp. SUPP950]